MQISKLAVRRPVTTVMVFLAFLLLGLISVTKIPQELFPPISYPQLTVVTAYPNAAPEEVESLVTKLIEEAVGTVGRVRRVSSVSREGLSQVTVEFLWGARMEFAALEVREKIDLVKERLPRETEEPVVVKFNPFDLPVVILSVTGRESESELLEISRRMIKDELDKTEGVASSVVSGGIEREILVEIDQSRLGAQDVSLTQVTEALTKANLNYPAGSIEEKKFSYLVRTMGEFQTVEEIADLAIESKVPEKPGRSALESLMQDESEERIQDRRLVLIRQIGQVKDTVKDRTSYSRYNGQPNITVAVQKQADAPTLRTVAAVKEKLLEIRETLPKYVDFEIVYDQSELITQAIQGVRDSAIIGGFLAFFVLLAFLKNFRAAFIVACVIPVSVMITLFMMYFQGLTLNMISLGGLALGLGMLVDASVVVIENIYRYRNQGLGIRPAAVKGGVEVAGAVTSSVLTTVAVFLPMIFVVGVAGQIFRELALTVTYSQIASLFVSLSLIPVLVAGIRRHRDADDSELEVDDIEDAPEEEEASGKIKDFFNAVLQYRWLVFPMSVVAFVVSLFLLAGHDKEFMPKIDQGEFVLQVLLPAGTRVEVTNEVVERIEKVLSKQKQIKHLTVSVGSSPRRRVESLDALSAHEARIIVGVTLPSRMAQLLSPILPNFENPGGEPYEFNSTREIVNDIRADLEGVDLGDAELDFVLRESLFASAVQSGAPVVVEVRGSELEEMEKWTHAIQRRMQGISGLADVKNNLALPSPETKVEVRKDRASLYRLSVADIARTAHIAIRGIIASTYKEGAREYDIKVRLREEDRSSVNSLGRVLMDSPVGAKMPLSELAALYKGLGPSEIRRVDQERVNTITANIAGRPLNEVSSEISSQIKGMNLPPDIKVIVTGEQEQMQDSFRSLQFALILSIILVYMIMASQFESLWQPFVIMFTVPLSLIGVAVGLKLTNTPLSVMVILGVIVLGGTVVNNGIVLIDFANISRVRGKSVYEAIRHASQIRLRPILMTALTTILAVLPLAMGVAKGSEIQSPMAVAIGFGLLFATFLTLAVIPCVYYQVASWMPEPEAALSEEEWEAVDLEEEESLLELPEPEPEQEPEPEAPLNLDTDLEGDLEEDFEEDCEDGPEDLIEEAARDAGLEEVPAPEEPEKTGQIPELGCLDFQLNERQQKFLRILTQKRWLTRTEYAREFDVSVPTAARDLKELFETGCVKAKGPLGPGRYYELTEIGRNWLKQSDSTR
ncbi:MAG: efflux RND transporter permease subunit [Candidatus Omnitrophica bacterium]|nr:efflux RND transporter permease subunit [Candidatus Omnitrophota bacterium]